MQGGVRQAAVGLSCGADDASTWCLYSRASPPSLVGLAWPQPRSPASLPPQLTRGAELQIEGGRHLLAEQLADAYIPNDTRMGAGSGRIQARAQAGPVLLLPVQLPCDACGTASPSRSRLH